MLRWRHLSPSASPVCRRSWALTRRWCCFLTHRNGRRPLAHASLGFALMFQREHDASIAAFERAIALNPNYVCWQFGGAHVLAGNSRRAIDVLEAYMRLDPFHAPVGLLGLAHYMLKQYSQALPILRDCVSRAPRLRPVRTWLAATYARLGQLGEARAESAEVLRIQPNFTIAGSARRIAVFKSAKDGKHFLMGCAKRGCLSSSTPPFEGTFRRKASDQTRTASGQGTKSLARQPAARGAIIGRLS
jgi:tetratricopeptide (TPR) repeat protein